MKIETLHKEVSTIESIINSDKFSWSELETYGEVIKNFVRVKDFRVMIPFMLNPNFDFLYFIRNIEDASFYEDVLLYEYREHRSTSFRKQFALEEFSTILMNTFNQLYKNIIITINDRKDKNQKSKSTKLTPILVDIDSLILNPEYLKIIPTEDYRNTFKLDDTFFYEEYKKFNLNGPLKLAMDSLIRSTPRATTWDDVPIENRKIKSVGCVIEYYIYTLDFPVEGDLINRSTLERCLYTKGTPDQLVDALKKQNIELVGRYFNACVDLSKGTKAYYKNWISQNQCFILNHIKSKKLKANLNLWIAGFYDDMK